MGGKCITRLVIASYFQEQVEYLVAEYLHHWIAGNDLMRRGFPASNAEGAEQEIRRKIQELHDNETVFINDIYQVNVRFLSDEFIHLSIKRRDRQTIHDWRDLQEIKNQILGPECEAIEIYPAESRLVDMANQYHLWGSKNPKYRLPFGFNDGRLVSDLSIGGTVNRPLQKKGSK